MVRRSTPQPRGPIDFHGWGSGDSPVDLDDNPDPDPPTGVDGEWLPLGSGLDARAEALTVYNRDLIVGGSFAAAGGQTAHRIARWDGSTWSSMGTDPGDAIRALTVHDGDLIAGRATGSAWRPMGSGMNARVLSLAVYQGELIAGGAFTRTGGQDASMMARWDGNRWQPLGGGVGWFVEAVHSHGNQLIATGWFTETADGAASYIARWTTP